MPKPTDVFQGLPGHEESLKKFDNKLPATTSSGEKQVSLSDVLDGAAAALDLSISLGASVPYLEYVAKCIGAVKKWKDLHKENSNEAASLAKQLIALQGPLEQLNGVRQELDNKGATLRDIAVDVRDSVELILEYTSSGRAERAVKAHRFHVKFTDMDKKIQGRKADLTLMYVQRQDKTGADLTAAAAAIRQRARQPKTREEAMQFLGTYEKKHEGYEVFKEQGTNLEGEHDLAERCRVILRDYWKSAVKKRGNKMDATEVTQGNNYRKLVEPLDIANYYRLQLHLQPEKRDGERHYLESDNRPTTYIELEKLYKKMYPNNNFVSSVGMAERQMGTTTPTTEPIEE